MHESIKLISTIKPTKNTVMLASFKGFSDMTGASAATIDYLIKEWKSKPVIEIDPDPFYDYTSTRPQVKLINEKRIIEWPVPTLHLATNPNWQNDFILLSAPEPNLKWKTFAEIIIEIMDLFNCSTSITLGAQPASIPHTRPVLINLSTSDKKFENLFDLKAPSFRYQGPTGITGILNLMFREKKWDNASLWALMPHYLMFGPNPNVIDAIVNKIDLAFQTTTSLQNLEIKKKKFLTQVDQALSNSPESSKYIKELEEEYDKSNYIIKNQINVNDDSELTLPSSNEIIGDIESFLKDNRE
jgi:predicted ATP-grasp superfamily ATP-dependent carboligase